MTTWFEKLTGFREESPDQVRENISVNGEEMTSLVNGRTLTYGRLEIPTLGELRAKVKALSPPKAKISIREVFGDVKQFHTDPSNAGAMFQVASQFNLLEMAAPHRIPEDGVGIYEFDRTQGPACAISAGAGTIYRNYFVEFNGRTGQTADNQIDCLADVGVALGNTNGRLWRMKNGYVFATKSGLAEITDVLRTTGEGRVDELRGLLRIGIHSDTEVTLHGAGQLVTQAYCSALPVGYSEHSSSEWTAFAQFVLEASYEATFCAAILNAAKSGNRRVFLTLLGGGVFGNNTEWIISAIERAVRLHSNADLDVAIVSYRSSNALVRQLCERL